MQEYQAKLIAGTKTRLIHPLQKDLDQMINLTCLYNLLH